MLEPFKTAAERKYYKVEVFSGKSSASAWLKAD
jgi:hypothetical protein